jgi:hypothetical protein
LVKTSAKFREEFANIVKTTEKRVAFATSSTLSANGTDSGNSGSQGNEGNSGAEGRNWKKYLGEVFTPEVTSNLVNNLFGLFSGKSPNEATDELRNADLRFQNQEPPKKGLSTGAIVGISVGVIALIGLTIYLVRK